ncbi:phage tail protein [Serratia sp. S1B]|nr:phage tail protein [Serratia sp. S1B]
MAKNEFLPFGIAAHANVLSNADYQALPARSVGFQSGVVKSQELNTAWRQSSVMAAVIGQFIADNSGNDVLDDGDLATLQKNLHAALNRLSLQSSDGSALPVGVPVPWPTATAPTGWLKCNGASFDDAKYPQLALVYPSGVLPDLRGEFIRGWDDGRGVDTGRAVLSSQQASKIGGQLYGGDTVGYGNQWWCDVDIPFDGWEQLKYETMDTSKPKGRLATPVGASGVTSVCRYTGYVRPRNLAFNYIVRAV